jgi:hypothetical protein
VSDPRPAGSAIPPYLLYQYKVENQILPIALALGFPATTVSNRYVSLPKHFKRLQKCKMYDSTIQRVMEISIFPKTAQKMNFHKRTFAG